MKVLVAAASRHGATEQIAGSIARILDELGLEAEVVPPDQVADIGGYDAAVIGSAVYAGHWLPAARDLVTGQAAALSRMPVWLFSSGPIGEPPKPTEPPAEALEHTRAINAIDHQVFEGKLDRSKLGFAEKAIVTVVGAAPGDYRSWDAVVAWSRSIARHLVGGVPAAATPATVAAP